MDLPRSLDYLPNLERSFLVDNTTTNGLSRRDVIKKTGQVAIASAFAGIAIPNVHAGETDTIKVALVGCGGRGTGAAENARATKSRPHKVCAMDQLFPDPVQAP